MLFRSPWPPRPLRSRPREPVVTSRFCGQQPTGRLILADIYEGRNMAGVERGEVKKLLVLEQLPRPANFSNGQEPLTVGGTFMIERILGTVPVEVSEAFERWDVLGMYEEQFHLDDDPLPHIPARTVAGPRPLDVDDLGDSRRETG